MVTRRSENEPDAGEARRRVVLLGASNLTRGFSTAVAMAQAIGEPPAKVFATLGHGRSYGVSTNVLGRQLPGILHCGLWRALEASNSLPTVALVTDIGNDLGYGFSAEQIARWVDECFDRLEKISSRVVVTELPVENFFSISNRRYLLLRSILFPRCRLSLKEIRQRAEALNQSVCASAERRNISVVTPRPVWFGLDPIHVRRRFFCAAWTEMMQPFSTNKSIVVQRSLGRWLALLRLSPEHYRHFGILRTVEQPSCRLKDSTTIALY